MITVETENHCWLKAWEDALEVKVTDIWNHKSICMKYCGVTAGSLSFVYATLFERQRCSLMKEVPKQLWLKLWSYHSSENYFVFYKGTHICLDCDFLSVCYSLWRQGVCSNQDNESTLLTSDSSPRADTDYWAHRFAHICWVTPCMDKASG